MKRKVQRAREAAPAQRVARRGGQSDKSAELGLRGSDLEKTLSLIMAHPGIRPSEINRLLNREEFDGLRGTLIKRGLVRKEKVGAAMNIIPFDGALVESVRSRRHRMRIGKRD